MVLEALALHGTASAAEIAAATKIPRATTYRLLETLRRMGYVSRRAMRETYRLTIKVREFAEAYKEEDWVTEIAAPVLTTLCDEVVWPTDICTFEAGHMVIRATTHWRSPLSILRYGAGRQLDMLTTGTGRGYLAFCPVQESQAILDFVLTLKKDRVERLLLDRDLEIIRRRGYAVRIRGRGNKTSSITVPIMHGDRVLACLTLVWIASALAAAVAVKRYLEPLKRAAHQIESAYSQQVDRAA